MKLVTLIIDENGKDFSLKFPLSRIQRNLSNIKVSKNFEGFEGRVQRDFNSSFIGPCMGPYDQNKVLSLSSQLVGTDLDFNKYTQFIHPEHLKCKSFAIKESYDMSNDLSKIDVLLKDDQKTEDDEKSDDDQDSDDDHIFYTCQFKRCKIPKQFVKKLLSLRNFSLSTTFQTIY